MTNDPEKYLASWRVPEPSADLEARVLATARAAWTAPVRGDLSPGFIFGVKIFFHAAAMVLLSILILNWISLSRPEREPVQYQAEVEQLVKLGLPRQNAKMMVVLRKIPAGIPGPSLQKMIMEGDPS